MPNTDDESEERPQDAEDRPLNERLLDLLVFMPAGIAVSVVEELPKLASIGRSHLEVRVSSARAVGQFALKAGRDEFQRRSRGLFPGRASGHRPAGPPPSTGPEPARPAPAASPVRSVPAEGDGGGGAVGGTASPSPTTSANGHVPPVSTLSIPGFDTLSASQVVQRLDGLNRSELVAVRAYEASSRGRRTILSRVDQLLDERS
jgi:hypothetical protein